MKDDESPEETERLEPRMFAQKAKVADAQAKKDEDEAVHNAETPRAPAVAALVAIAGETPAPKTVDVKAPEPTTAKTKDAATEEKPKPPIKKELQKDRPLDQRVKEWARENIDGLIGGGIATTYVAWLLGTARELGFSRDEGFYFAAASDYQRWFKILFSTPGKALERTAIDASWAANHEHPSLMKSLFALSHMFLYDKWKLFTDQSTAFRFPGMLSMGLALFVTYTFAAKLYSRRAGIIAAIALGLMPNVFYHAHLACFDVPIMAMWITCVYAYWRAEKLGGIGPALLAGIVYGLTLETKHNAWMLPAVFLPHALLVHGKSVAEDATKSARIFIPASLAAMATIGPAVFLALWPWMWNDTVPRLQEYVNFHVHHEYYNIEFLGTTYFGPPSPRSYMPVMILATVPTITLVLWLVGAVDRAKLLAARVSLEIGKLVEKTLPWPKTQPESDPLHSDALLFLAMAVPLAVFLLPSTPIFGGTKHWIPAYPALCIFAGRGFDLVATKIDEVLRARGMADAKRLWAVSVVGAVTFLAPFAVTRHSHPFGLSAYVPFFGGTAGGADLGLNRQFWGFTTESLGPWLEKNTKPGDTMYIMDTSWPAWQRMVDEKRVPPWLRGVGSPAEAEIAIVHHEQHINEVDYNIWTEYGLTAPEYVLEHDGVPIISVYRRPKSKQNIRHR